MDPVGRGVGNGQTAVGSGTTDSPLPAADRPLPARIERFALSTRLLHWLNAALFLILLVSGFLIYIPAVKAPAIGGYRLVPLLHIIFGIAWILAPLSVVILLRRRRALIADVTDALAPEPGDVAWLRYAVLTVLGARLRPPRTGKFNAGQKLNTWYWLLASVALATTGLVLAVNVFTKSVFEAAFVEQVFPLHQLIALISLIPLAGHLYVALVNRSTRPALSGMVDGNVDAQWAREHHPDWYESVHGG